MSNCTPRPVNARWCACQGGASAPGAEQEACPPSTSKPHAAQRNTCQHCTASRQAALGLQVGKYLLGRTQLGGTSARRVRSEQAHLCSRLMIVLVILHGCRGLMRNQRRNACWAIVKELKGHEAKAASSRIGSAFRRPTSLHRADIQPFGRASGSRGPDAALPEMSSKGRAIAGSSSPSCNSCCLTTVSQTRFDQRPEQGQACSLPATYTSSTPRFQCPPPGGADGSCTHQYSALSTQPATAARICASASVLARSGRNVLCGRAASASAAAVPL